MYMYMDEYGQTFEISKLTVKCNSDLYDIHFIFFVHPSCAPGIIYWAIVDSGPKAG